MATFRRSIIDQGEMATLNMRLISETVFSKIPPREAGPSKMQ